MVKTEEELQYNPDLMSSSSQGENETNKGVAPSKTRQQQKKKKKKHQFMPIIYPSLALSIFLPPFFLALVLSP